MKIMKRHYTFSVLGASGALTLCALFVQTVFIMRTVTIDGALWHYGTVALYGFELLAILTITVAYFTDQSARNALNTTALPLLLLVLVVARGAPGAPDPPTTLWWSIIIALATAFGITITSILQHYTRLFIVSIITGGTCAAAIGIVQFLTQSIPASTLLGISAHDNAFGGTATVTTHFGRFIRAYGTFAHPNIFAGILVFALIIALFVIARTRITYAVIRGMLLFSITLMSMALWFTFSRAGIVALLCAGTFLLWKLHYAWKRWLSGVITICAATCITFLAFGDIFLTRSAQSITPTFNAYTDRAQFAHDAIDILRMQPLFGTGTGTSTLAIAQKDNFTHPIWNYQPAHITPLLLLAEHGVIGTLLFISILTLLLLHLRRALRSVYKGSTLSSTPLSTALVIALMPPFLMDHWLITSHIGIFILMLVLCFYASTRQT